MNAGRRIRRVDQLEADAVDGQVDGVDLQRGRLPTRFPALALLQQRQHLALRLAPAAARQSTRSPP